MIRKLIVVAGSLLIAGMAVLMLWVFRRPPPILSVAVSFTGYSNDAAGTRLATFALTNQGTVEVMDFGAYRVESQQQVNVAYKQGTRTPGGTWLPPGQVENFALVAPSNVGPWRIQAYCARDGLRRKLNNIMGESLLPKRLRGLPAETFPHSDWIPQ